MVDATITTATEREAIEMREVRYAPYRWLVVTILLIAVTTAFFDRINVAVLFANADFKQAIGVGNNPALLGLLMTGFVFAYGLSAFALSIISDLFGPRRTLSFIALALAVVMAFMGGAMSYATMFGGRVLLGLIEGPQFGAANVAVKQWFPPNQRGLATALWGIGAPLGSMIGFPLIIALVASFGWRASFYLLAGLNGLIVLPIVWFMLRNHNAAPQSAPAAKTMPIKEAIPLLLGNARFWLLAVYDCGAMIYLWGFNSWLPTYLQVARHFDIKHSGLFSSLPFLIMIGGYFLGGWLGDRFRAKALICLCGLMAAGFLILAATMVEDATQAALLLALSAGAWGMTVPTLFAMGTEIVPKEVTAMGFGLYAGAANIVGAAAPLVIGIVIGSAGNYAGGLMVIVIACVALSLTMIPLLRRH
ncbi:MFS transporter [Beijerinckia sp. L45]|uniref:MFS transporter n=1 Tax=Beijerinckia sp. L45 TaxID=1641855 RepID=UPI00131AA879|nr:MFS transporter [Beijerinckia sp. L45]